MSNFTNDYSQGAHPRILQALQETNHTSQPGYSRDEYCRQAQENIQQHLKSPKSTIHFVTGGTQANLISLAWLLKPYQSIISAQIGHIYNHEAGAIEATGHKIHNILTPDGKLTPPLIKPLLQEHQSLPDHMVEPKVVYLTNSTELGTVYTKKELQILRNYCQKEGLLIYLDGARLGAALTDPISKLNLADLPHLTDMFCLGATKNGGLLGEAIIINNPDFQPNFHLALKQRGALLAKSRLLGLQFRELFRDDLFLELASQANQKAQQISNTIKKLGFSLLSPSTTNQIFPILPTKIITKLQKKYHFYTWKPITPKQTAIRLITSWDTPPQAIKSFQKDLQNLSLS